MSEPNQNKNLNLWQRWKLIEPRKRIVISFTVLVFSSLSLFFEPKEGESNIMNHSQRPGVTIKTIDYSKPADKRVSITRDGVDVTKEELEKNQNKKWF
ncbi:hypothetical protein CYY_009766 [Polysphondylium violaceum]|uniref:Uncharacterized protein n=1 Tax=Polysphondylium violaceum TaxID=133409 RepID=A0A8J4PL44_9MYCE|nr:hypothetical protein CYY_009766 [Polysphondylium violaceum]